MTTLACTHKPLHFFVIMLLMPLGLHYDRNAYGLAAAALGMLAAESDQHSQDPLLPLYHSCKAKPASSLCQSLSVMVLSFCASR
jgi:hypothetical protein